MQPIYIYNNDTISNTYSGQTITDDTYYQLQPQEQIKFSTNDALLDDISSAKAIISTSNSSAGHISGTSAQVDYLKGNTAKEVIVQEEGIKTGGRFQEMSYCLDVGSEDTSKVVNVSFPIPVSLLSATWQNKSSFLGDSIEFSVAPDTTTGTITADVAVDDTIISVSQTVIDNARIGYFIKLYDGTNTEDLGRVTNIDKDNSKITVAVATTQAFTASTPTYVKQTVKMLPKSPLDDTGPMFAGESKIGGSYIPANTTLKAEYFNDNATAKKMIFFLEYLY